MKLNPIASALFAASMLVTSGWAVAQSNAANQGTATAPATRAPATTTAPAPTGAANSAATNTNTAERQAWDRRHRASKIIGTDVRNPEGDKIGDIKDLIVDDQGHVTLAIVSTGGFLGIGDRLHAIPWSSLKMATTDQGKADKGDRILNMTKDQLKDVPGFESEHWPNFSDQDWVNKNRGYFGGNAASSGTTGSATTTGATGTGSAASGTTAGSTGATGSAGAASGSAGSASGSANK